MTQSLFDVEPGRASIARDRRQLADLIRGIHPINGYPLHEHAATTDRSMGGLRCHDCYFAVRVTNNVFKCGVDEGRHITGSPASDLQLWFPACTRHIQDTMLTPP